LSASRSGFDTLYDYYFPKSGSYINTGYRERFDSVLFRPLRKSANKHDRAFYTAFHGDSRAFHEFVGPSVRPRDENVNESWIYECVLLLLKIGDDRFSQLLAREDRQTREAVGVAIDTQINWSKHNFPKTRALYGYRYKRPRTESYRTSQGPRLLSARPLAAKTGMGMMGSGKIKAAFDCVSWKKKGSCFHELRWSGRNASGQFGPLACRITS
jgi:hypothetical protein